MRVTDGMRNRQTLKNIRSSSTKLLKAQNAVSSQKAIEKLSDNPAGVARSMRIRAQIASMIKYSGNMDEASDRLETVDISLSAMSDILGRLKELSQEASNATRSGEDLKGIAAEASALYDHIVAEANAQSDGKYIFSGDSPWIKPFTDDGAGNIVYSGNSLRDDVLVAPGVTVPVGLVGTDVFVDSSAGGFGDLFVEVKDFIADLQAGDFSAMPGHMDALDKAFAHMVAARSMAGAQAAALAENRGLSARLDASIDGSKELLSEIEDIDFEEAVTYMAQQETIYQASLSVAARTASRRTLVDYLK